MGKPWLPDANGMKTLEEDCTEDNSSKVTLAAGEKSQAVYAWNFGFDLKNASGVELPQETDIDTVLVEIRSKGSRNGKIIADVLHLTKPAILIPNEHAQDPPTMFEFVATPDRTGACRLWSEGDQCVSYSSFLGTPEQWGFTGKRVKYEDPNTYEKHWLSVREVMDRRFGVVFRCRNLSETTEFTGFVNSIQIKVTWTDKFLFVNEHTSSPQEITVLG